MAFDYLNRPSRPRPFGTRRLGIAPLVCIPRTLPAHAVPEKARRAVLRYSELLQPEAVAQVLASQHETDLTPFVARINTPTAIVHARFDRVRRLDDARAMAAAIPLSKLHVLASGHTACLEAPRACAAVARDVVARSGDSYRYTTEGDHCCRPRCTHQTRCAHTRGFASSSSAHAASSVGSPTVRLDMAHRRG